MSTLTIGMPVFNDVQFIEESLKSILNQTFQDFTLIISDDCSTDGSAEFCKRFAQIDKRIKYIRQPAHLGISRNLTFLFQQANTKYFMWAADDDIWANNFVEKLIQALEHSKGAIVAFCTFSRIDERGNVIEQKLDFNFSNPSKISRLRNFIRNSDDTFGYGLFLTDRMSGVEFPVWWWPNQQCGYNNIFPSLCFYLTKWNYVHIYDDPLFFKRIKNKENQNHVLPYPEKGLRKIFAFFIRRFNLVFFSSRMIRKGGNWFLSFLFFPLIFYHWFVISSFKVIINQYLFGNTSLRAVR